LVFVGGGGWLNTSYGERGWLKTSEYRHTGGGGLQLLKKPSYDIWTFPNCVGSGSSL